MTQVVFRAAPRAVVFDFMIHIDWHYNLFHSEFRHIFISCSTPFNFIFIFFLTSFSSHFIFSSFSIHFISFSSHFHFIFISFSLLFWFRAIYHSQHSVSVLIIITVPISPHKKLLSLRKSIIIPHWNQLHIIRNCLSFCPSKIFKHCSCLTIRLTLIIICALRVSPSDTLLAVWNGHCGNNYMKKKW